jgi:hypothetical protein
MSKRVRRVFRHKLSLYLEQKLQREYVFHLGFPKEHLVEHGFADYPLKLKQSILTKARKKHKLDLKELEELPKFVEEPVMIFKSRAREDSRVVVTEYYHEPEKGLVVLAVQLEAKKRDLVLHEVRSLYPKKMEGLLDWIEDDLLLFAHKKKVHNWIGLSTSSEDAQPQSTSLTAPSDSARTQSIMNLVTKVLECVAENQISEEENP